VKFVLCGASGQLGAVLNRAFVERGHDVTVVSRREVRGSKTLLWDGRSLGAWTSALEGADVVVNLAGRSVNCRYTRSNLEEMMNSRVDSTRILGEAIQATARPPRVWLQMSTATIYAHRFDAANDEATGIIGGSEPDAPAYWKYSIDIAEAWERAQAESDTPQTRKVALRSSMVMSADPGGIFHVLLGLVRKGLGGPVNGGTQFVSWIHQKDFVRALLFLIEREDFSGPVNVASPNPLPQREFMQALRAQVGVKIGLPATAWMAKIGAVFLRTDTELILKSRRVVPGRLLQAGFEFEFPNWPAAAEELMSHLRG
jgi:uncharacterized protein